jgi:hypothetical protein
MLCWFQHAGHGHAAHAHDLLSMPRDVTPPPRPSARHQATGGPVCTYHDVLAPSAPHPALLGYVITHASRLSTELFKNFDNSSWMKCRKQARSPIASLLHITSICSERYACCADVHINACFCLGCPRLARACRACMPHRLNRNRWSSDTGFTFRRSIYHGSAALLVPDSRTTSPSISHTQQHPKN